MTRVEVHYDLTRPIDDTMLDQIARVHAVYGIIRVTLSPGYDSLTVEYDASRLSGLDVETTLRKHGLPVGLRV